MPALAAKPCPYSKLTCKKVERYRMYCAKQVSSHIRIGMRRMPGFCGLRVDDPTKRESGALRLSMRSIPLRTPDCPVARSRCCGKGIPQPAVCIDCETCLPHWAARLGAGEALTNPAGCGSTARARAPEPRRSAAGRRRRARTARPARPPEAARRPTP